MSRDVLLVPLFERFIKDTLRGKRRKLNGERIKVSTIKNYEEVLKKLKAFESHKRVPLRVKINIKNNRREILLERDYWKNFYNNYSDYLFKHGCFDNYVGNHFKIVKCFFRYLKNEQYLRIYDYYENFYVRREDIRIITLLPERFCFLVMDDEFNRELPINLRRVKDMMVFGCVCALRYYDLTHLKVKDVEKQGEHHFLYFRSCKTDTPVHIKLPPFAVDIYKRYSRRKKPGDKLFPFATMDRFNTYLRRIARLAGWTELIGKVRSKNGEPVELLNKQKRYYRFCDLVTSHIMRRTGITILLMLEMPEYLVRKISGHAAHSKSFFRYVNFAQSYITDEIDKAHAKLLALWDKRDKIKLDAQLEITK
jgi:hypothetical protein